MAGGAACERHYRHIGAFNPAWCLRPQATGDDLARRWADGLSSSTSLSSSRSSSSGKPSSRRRSGGAAFEPRSPRVGCMGQIKDSSCSSSCNKFRLLGLRKVFTGMNILALAPPPGRRRMANSATARAAVAPVICVSQLDPPLPVVQRAADVVQPTSIWARRRCGEVLPLDGIRHLPHKQPPPPCVYFIAA